MSATARSRRVSGLAPDEVPVFKAAARWSKTYLSPVHPWTRMFGDRDAEVFCACCGALINRVVVDAEDRPWGVDCWRTVTGQRVETPKQVFTMLMRIIRPGGSVFADGEPVTAPRGGYLFAQRDEKGRSLGSWLVPLDVGPDAELLAALGPGDRGRCLARMERDGLC